MIDHQDQRNPRQGPVKDGPGEAGMERRQSVAVLLRWSPGRNWLALMLACSIICNVFILWRYGSRGHTGRSPIGVSPEVSLGDYQCVVAEPSQLGVSGAEFSLHIALLDETDLAARARLAARDRRVRQGVEELLRRVHSDDFADPALEDLKRQLQERINAILEMRAISEVIITNLVLHRVESGATSASTIAEMAQSPLNQAVGLSRGQQD